MEKAIRRRPERAGEGSSNLNGQPYTVIGVLAKDYRSAAGFGLSPEFYLPISRATDGDLNQRSRASLDMFCRLPKGTSVQQAAAALAPVTAELERLYPETNRGMSKASRFFPLSGLGAFEGSGAPRENPHFRRSAVCSGRTGAADRLRERGQSVVGARREPAARNRDPSFLWERAARG
jgi:hypothetical protein